MLGFWCGHAAPRLLEPPCPLPPRRGVGLAPPPDGDRLRQKEGGVRFPGKGLICYFSAKFSPKQQVLGAHKAPIPKPHPQAFPRKSSYLKCITQLKVPFYYSVGENVQSSMYTYVHTHKIVTAVGCVFIQTSILREKSKVLQPCTVYIY